MGARLRRRRARGDTPAPTADPAVTAGGESVEPFAYGYGGWSVSLDNVAMPETAPPKARAEPAPAPPAPEPEPGEPPLAERPPAAEPATAVREPEPEPEPVPEPEPEPALAAAEPAPPVEDAAPAEPRVSDVMLPAPVEPPAPVRPAPAAEDDRPIIAAPTRRAATLEARTPRLPRRPDRTERTPRGANPSGLDVGARKRTAQRIEGGGTVIIEERLFPLVDWSSGGIAIRSEGHLYRIGDVRMLEIEIDLGDYAVNMDVEGEVANRSSDRTGWRFVNPTEDQRQVLRTLTNASLHGKPFTAPLPKAEGVPEPKRAKRKVRRGRGFSPLAALMSLPFNLAIIALVAGVAILTMSAEKARRTADAPAVTQGAARAEHAAVAVERVALWTDDAGLILEWAVAPGQEVARGAQVVVVATDAGGERRAIVSPCDCVLARILADPGERTVRGQTVGLLYPRDAQGHVQALFRRGAAPSRGAHVIVDLPYSGEQYQGVVERVGQLADPQSFIGLPAPIFTADPGSVYARIKTMPPIPAALAGDPAIVTVRPAEP